MNEKIIKILTVILMIVMIISISLNVFAGGGITPSQITSDGSSVQGASQMKNVANGVVGILRVVGVILSVVILIILGIKYMMGSAEEKADYKKSMMPYIVGAALIFAASAFAQVIYQFFTGISTGK